MASANCSRVRQAKIPVAKAQLNMNFAMTYYAAKHAALNVHF
jgi:hypothetical protein